MRSIFRVPQSLAARQHVYFILMGTCLVLIVLAWTLVWHYSVVAAVAMSAAALIIPPVAVIIANASDANRQ